MSDDATLARKRLHAAAARVAAAIGHDPAAVEARITRTESARLPWRAEAWVRRWDSWSIHDALREGDMIAVSEWGATPEGAARCAVEQLRKCLTTRRAEHLSAARRAESDAEVCLRGLDALNEVTP